MEEIQLDILISELQGLLDAADRCLEPGIKASLQSPVRIPSDSLHIYEPPRKERVEGLRKAFIDT
jgi:hypothetical protein